MAELLKTQCTQDHLVITDTAIIVELTAFGKTLKSETLQRTAYTNMDTKQIGAQMFSKRPSTTSFKFYGQGGKIIEASLVNGKDALAVISILTGRE